MSETLFFRKSKIMKTLKCKISDFLNSNTCFCSRLFGKFSDGIVFFQIWDFKEIKSYKFWASVNVILCECSFYLPLFFIFCDWYYEFNAKQDAMKKKLNAHTWAVEWPQMWSLKELNWHFVDLYPYFDVVTLVLVICLGS